MTPLYPPLYQSADRRIASKLPPTDLGNCATDKRSDGEGVTYAIFVHPPLHPIARASC